MNTIEIKANSLDDIRRATNRLARKIGAGPSLLPTYASSDHSGRPHFEFDGEAYYYVICERGEEYDRKRTLDPKEVLLWAFDSVTSNLAFAFELENRVSRQDSRRIAFAKQIELLEILDESWAKAVSEQHLWILAEHPFDDLASVRATRTRELREAGSSDDEAWRIACSDYPLPSGAA